MAVFDMFCYFLHFAKIKIHHNSHYISRFFFCVSLNTSQIQFFSFHVQVLDIYLFFIHIRSGSDFTFVQFAGLSATERLSFDTIRNSPSVALRGEEKSSFSSKTRSFGARENFLLTRFDRRCLSVVGLTHIRSRAAHDGVFSFTEKNDRADEMT